MKQLKKVRSAYPVYLIAVVWLLMTFLTGLHSVLWYVVAIVLSVAAYLGGKQIWPDQVIEYDAPEPKPAPEPEPKDPEMVALKKERDESIQKLRALNDEIPDPVISGKISHIEEVSGRIYQVVLEKPDKKSQIQRFQSYYLPTTIKLLETYVRLGKAGVNGENITAARAKIEGLLTTICTAFDRQLDALYSDTAMDIAAEAQVLETMLQQQGLAGENPFRASAH